MTRPGLRVQCAVLITLLIATGVWADYKDSYRAGVTAAENGDWSETRRMMQEAIAQNPTETRKKVKLYGNRYKEYIPHYYLGVAQYHLGECAASVRSFDTSERQGAVQRTREYNDLQRFREECRSRLPSRPAASPTARQPAPTATSLPATATPAPTAIPPTATPRRAVPSPTPRGQDPRLLQAIGRAETAITDAGRAEGTLRRLAGDPRYDAAWLATADAARQRDEAFQTLDRARQKLSTGRRNGSLADLEEAATLATHANNMLASLPARLEAARSTSSRTEPPRASPSPRPPRPTPTAAPTVPVLPQATTTAPDELTAAVQAFLAGEHERVVATLAETRFANRRVSAVAHLVRAASSWALYRRGGDSDQMMHDQAEADVRDCRTLDGDVRPDAEAFSPSFVEFFEGTR